MQWDIRTQTLPPEHQSLIWLPKAQKGLEPLEYLPPQNWCWTIPPSSPQEAEGRVTLDSTLLAPSSPSQHRLPKKALAPASWARLYCCHP